MVLFIIGLAVKWLTVRIIRRKVEDQTVKLVWTQIANLSIGLVLLLILSWIWLEGVGSILALLTLIAAAMTIVHKELILNFTSWSIIAWRGLFKLNDHIEISSNIGEVVDIGPIYFTIQEATGVDTGLRPTGRTIRIPNALVLTQAVVNYSDQHVRWSETSFGVPLDSDWKKARKIIEDVIAKHTESAGFKPSKPTHLATTVEAVDSKVVLTAHYPVRPSARLQVQSDVTAEILTRFTEAGLKLA